MAIKGLQVRLLSAPLIIKKARTMKFEDWVKYVNEARKSVEVSVEQQRYHMEIEKVQERWNNILSLLNDAEVAMLTYSLEVLEPKPSEWRKESILVWEGLLNRIRSEYDARNLHYSGYENEPDWDEYTEETRQVFRDYLQTKPNQEA